MRPAEILTVRLEAQVWEHIMRALAKGPYEMVAPLIAEIQRQCANQERQPDV